jgi:L,D-transpeptidase catalytic domain
MKISAYVLLLIAVITTSFGCIKGNSPNANSTKDRIQTQLKQVRKTIESNPDCNTEMAFFIDMKIFSGKNRFFIYNLKTNKIIDQGLVAHGSGSETENPGILKFSNTENSLCTALGNYTIGNSYVGKFGKSYKLFGLDPTNNNAFKRNIVLHSYFKMPYEEQEEDIVNSYGCPMVNEKFYTRIQKIIDHSKKKIVLTIYY